MDKALYVINGESGGNPQASGDGGSSLGLFQIHKIHGFDEQTRMDPEENIRIAAQVLGAAKGNWKPWGEGTTYKGNAFGALGNNPYEGTNQVGSSGNPSVDVLNKPPTPGIPNKSNTIITGSGSKGTVYQPTGDFATDSGYYWSESQKAWGELAQYQQDSSHVINIDEEEGVVYIFKGQYDIEGNPIVEVDTTATKLLQKAQSNAASLDNLYAARQAGLLGGGTDSAQAYLQSETDKANAASRTYDDYVKRIEDIAAIESIPVNRSMNMASAIRAMNEARGSRTYGPGKGLSGRPQDTNFQPFADSIKGTLPDQAPAPYNVDPAAYAPPPSNQMKIPGPKPEEVLASYGVATPITQTLFNTTPANVSQVPSDATKPGVNVTLGSAIAPFAKPNLPKPNSFIDRIR